MRKVVQHEGRSISTEEARGLGLTRYFTGIPCRKGHVAERMLSNRRCIVCLKESWKARARALYGRHNSRRRAKRAVNPEEAREKDRANYARNPERKSKNAKRYRAEKGDHIKALQKISRKKHIARILASNANRRARENGAEGRCTAADVERIRAMQKDRCAICRVRLNRAGARDHIRSLAQGGTNWPQNIQLLCTSCNSRKKHSDPIEFMQSLGRLL